MSDAKTSGWELVEWHPASEPPKERGQEHWYLVIFALGPTLAWIDETGDWRGEDGHLLIGVASWCQLKGPQPVPAGSLTAELRRKIRAALDAETLREQSRTLDAVGEEIDALDAKLAAERNAQARAERAERELAEAQGQLGRWENAFGGRTLDAAVAWRDEVLAKLAKCHAAMKPFQALVGPGPFSQEQRRLHNTYQETA